MKRAILAAFLFSLTGWLVVSLGPRDKGQTIALAAAPGAKAESIARGGLVVRYLVESGSRSERTQG